MPPAGRSLGVNAPRLCRPQRELLPTRWCPVSVWDPRNRTLTNEHPGGEVYPMRAGRRAGLASLPHRVPGGALQAVGMCLLLGAPGVGKTLLVKRLQTILQYWPRGPERLARGWGAPGVTRARGRRTPWGLERELGGVLGSLWGLEKGPGGVGGGPGRGPAAVRLFCPVRRP